MKRTILQNTLAFGLIAAAVFTSCSKNDNNNDDGGTTTTGNYLVTGILGTATYVIAAPSLDNATDTISPTGNNGLEYSNTFTHYVGTTYGPTGVKYGQGGAHIYQSFTVASDGRATLDGPEREIPNGFNAVNTVGNYVLTLRYSQTLPDNTTGAVFNFYDMTNQTAGGQTRYLTTTNFSDVDLNGKNLQLQGICDLGNNQFMTALYVSPMSLDSVYVGQFSYDANFNVTLDKVYKDSRISVASAGNGSTRYSFIKKVDNGDIYVFSPSSNSGTTKTPAALRIKSGATTFDQSYYFNIDEKSEGRRFRRVYQVSDDYMILEFYNDANTTSGLYGKYAVLRMSTQEFNWITGLPDATTISSASWGYSINGKFYVGLTFANALPAIYSFDHLTHTAKQGLVVKDITSIGGIGMVAK